MARGWESKSVETQMESAVDGGRSETTKHLSISDIERNHQKNSLLLSRTRVLGDLESATNPRYKQMLTEALAELDKRLLEFN